MLCSGVGVIKSICSHSEYSSAAATLPKMGLAVDYKLITAQALKPDHSEQRNFALGWVCVSKGDAGFCSHGHFAAGIEFPGLDLPKMTLTSSHTHMAFYRLALFKCRWPTPPNPGKDQDLE